MAVVLTFDQLFFETEELPVAIVGEPYTKQLEASGGTPPYYWNMIYHYDMEYSEEDFPEINENKLTPSDTIRGIAEQKIDFSFPFYSQSYDTLYIHTEGFIMFDSQSYPWPYLYDQNLMIRKTKIIAPLLNRNNVLDTANGDGIWFEGNENYAAFRWCVTSIKPEISTANFAAIIYPSGNIEFYYGDNEIIPKQYWSSGISLSDDINYHYVQFDNNIYENGDLIQFTPELFPGEMFLDEDGLFYGTPENYYNGVNLEFVVTDYNNIPVRRILPFYSWYAGTDEISNQKIQPIRIFPNPASDFITIEFELVDNSFVTIDIIDQSGKKLSTIANKQFNAGNHQIYWNTLISGTHLLKNGVYYCSVKTDTYRETEKFVVLNRN
jgi:hypothetical protein